MAAGSLKWMEGRLFSNEASLPRQVKEMANEIISELQAIIRALTTDEAGRSLVMKQITDVVHEVDDIIDDCLYHMIKNQKYKLKGLLKKFKYENQFVTRLEKIKSDLPSIKRKARQRGNEVGLIGSKDAVAAGETLMEEQQQQQHYFRDPSTFASDSDLVGIEKNRSVLIGWLIDAAESRLMLNWVVGMGGMGKTTLMAHVYKSPQLENHFDCCAWVTVPESYTVESLLKSIIKDLMRDLLRSRVLEDAAPQLVMKEYKKVYNILCREEEEHTSQTFSHLVELLSAYLHKKRYLIFLDHVLDDNFWNRLKSAFPDHGCASRIVITTRREDVAHDSSSGFASRLLHIEPLQENEAWHLFCKRAFSVDDSSGAGTGAGAGDGDCPPALEKSARAIVAICEGLPLAIVAFGDLMSQKGKAVDDWTTAEDSRTQNLINFLGY